APLRAGQNTTLATVGLGVTVQQDKDGMRHLKLATSSSIPISVTNAASTSAAFSTTNFVVPSITSTVLSFGSISMTQLSDNNLAVCGSNGRTQCTGAQIRMYTTGVAGAGVYNASGGYGAPLSAGQNTTLTTVGLNSANAASLQTATIASTIHVLGLSAFSTPSYNVQADFSNAGTGSYSTTLVIEYVLTL
ncbi:MAG: hypothetical protein WCK42_08435, partial [Myxococcaceae bacterium]